MTTTPATPLDAALAWFDAWTHARMDEAMSFVAADVVCDAPAGRLTGVQEFRGFLEPFACTVARAELIGAFGDATTALIMYDTVTPMVPSAPGAEHLTFAGGRIVRSRFLFDRAPFLAARAAVPS